MSDSWISFEEIVPDAREIEERIASADGEFPWLVACDGGAVVGYAYASPHRARAAYRWSVDVSIYLDEKFRRTGIARRLYETLFAFLTAQRYCNVYAGIALPNAGSIAFHRALGFTTVGVYRNVGFKMGAWHDTMWLERPLAPHGSQPAAPLRIDALDPKRVARILEA